jgi:hypothetical protein
MKAPFYQMLLGHIYTISTEEGLRLREGEAVVKNDETLTISIDEDIPQSMKEELYFRKIVSEIIERSGGDVFFESNFDVCEFSRSFAIQLYIFLRDNASVFGSVFDWWNIRGFGTMELDAS